MLPQHRENWHFQGLVKTIVLPKTVTRTRPRAIDLAGLITMVSSTHRFRAGSRAISVFDPLCPIHLHVRSGNGNLHGTAQ
jgi:hypothetical protein